MNSDLLQNVNKDSSIKVEQVPILDLKDEELVRLSEERLLSLSLDEMRSVQNYFRQQGREPRDIELETIAQTWSEHCKHKTFKGIIEYTEATSHGTHQKTYDNLLKETIAKATKELSRDFCLSVFEDNAGIISFNEHWALAFKVETHNHPSALEPYGGAGTGIGGVIRDVLGAGLGAKPVLNTDVFCVGEFGSSSGDGSGLPPERILNGVISGVRDYGNRMGIPTANGAVLFHEGYGKNPLVFCGTLGLIPKEKIHKKVSPGELIVAIGGRTGRDGIHGATFSSLSLEKGISASVVQIGNAIVEKKTAEVILRARDANLFSALTDCGAGGFSSAVGELANPCGARVALEKAPLKYEGLSPWEVWLSESQERMVLSVPKENLDAFREICATEDVECSALGEFSNDGVLSVSYRGEEICRLDLKFLHDGIPRLLKKAVWKVKEEPPVETGTRKESRGGKLDCGKTLLKLLAHPNIGSKEWVIRQYDHEVQGGSVVKPLLGENYMGPSDACVYRPLLDSWEGVAVSNGINPFYGEIDPYWMAANVIEEALRNLVSVGGNIDHCAILDNFCWGDVNEPEILGGLARCSQGCYDFSKAFSVPFISGKDSLNNTWKMEGEKGKLISAPGTLLISALSVIRDVRNSVTMDFKRTGNLILILGETKDEMGGSHFNRILGRADGSVPKVNADLSRKMMKTLHACMEKGWVRSCHDLSEGGVAVALAEMAIAGNLGATLDLPKMVDDASVFLFSESASRWAIEIELKNLAGIKKMFSELPWVVLGRVTKNLTFKINYNKKAIVNLSVSSLEKSWRSFSDRASARKYRLHGFDEIATNKQ